jgi:hypothetical protein
LGKTAYRSRYCHFRVLTIWRALYLAEISNRIIFMEQFWEQKNLYLSEPTLCYKKKRERRKIKERKWLFPQDTFLKLFFKAASLSSSHHAEVGKARGNKAQAGEGFGQGLDSPGMARLSEVFEGLERRLPVAA